MTASPRHLHRVRWAAPDGALDLRYRTPRPRWRYRYYTRLADAQRRAEQLREAGYLTQLDRIGTAGPWTPVE